MQHLNNRMTCHLGSWNESVAGIYVFYRDEIVIAYFFLFRFSSSRLIQKKNIRAGNMESPNCEVWGITIRNYVESGTIRYKNSKFIFWYSVDIKHVNEFATSNMGTISMTNRIISRISRYISTEYTYKLYSRYKENKLKYF